MQNRILYNKKNGTPIQIIAKAQTKPVLQDVICYQELEPPYDYFVMEKNQFFEEYVRSFQGLPRNDKKQLEVKEDLPGPVGEEKEETDEKLKKMLEFLDADTYREKLKIFESMKNDLNDHILNNIAVSLDLSIEDGMDGYQLILSELKMRSKYETARGERL